MAPVRTNMRTDRAQSFSERFVLLVFGKLELDAFDLQVPDRKALGDVGFLGS